LLIWTYKLRKKSLGTIIIKDLNKNDYTISSYCLIFSIALDQKQRTALLFLWHKIKKKYYHVPMC